MNTEMLVASHQNLPLHILQEIRRYFPDKPLDELTIRYYDSVENVGHEYFTQTVLSACYHEESVRYLEPFICFVRLGEALILSKDGCLIYDNQNNGDYCTETGPFWFVTAKTK